MVSPACRKSERDDCGRHVVTKHASRERFLKLEILLKYAMNDISTPMKNPQYGVHESVSTCSRAEEVYRTNSQVETYSINFSLYFATSLGHRSTVPDTTFRASHISAKTCDTVVCLCRHWASIVAHQPWHWKGMLLSASRIPKHKVRSIDLRSSIFDLRPTKPSPNCF